MTLLGGRRTTKSPSRRSHGLRDIYEVPFSALRDSSPPITDHSPRPLRMGKTNGMKRAKPGLRVSRKSGNSNLRYERTVNGVGRTQDREREELATKGQIFLRDNEQVHSTHNSRVYEIGPQLDGIPEVARQRLMKMALEGLFVTGDLSSVDNAGGTAASILRRRKAITQEATIPVEYPTTKIPNRKDFNTAGICPEARLENEEFCTMQCQEAHISTLEGGRHTNEKDVPVPIFINAIPALEPSSASQIEAFDVNISPTTSGPVGGRSSTECGRSIDTSARANVPYPASLLDIAVELRNQNITNGQMPQTFAKAINAEIDGPDGNASSELDVYAIDTSTPNADIVPEKRRIEAIEDLRMNEDGHTDFLVKWEDIDYEFATWEHEEVVVSSAPKLLIQYLKAIIFADKRIEQAERDKDPKCNQLLTERFPENDTRMLENNGRVEDDISMKDGQDIRDGDTIEDSQSFGEDESIGDEQLLRFDPALECKPLRAVEPSARKRGRGRPRKSDKSTLTTRVSRRTATIIVDHLEMSGLSMRNGLRQASNASSGSQSRPSQSDFLMPSAEEVLEAAKELAKSRDSRQSLVNETAHRQKYIVKSQKTSMSISSDGTVENPYKKYYLTGQSNRRLKSKRAARSQRRGAVRRVRPLPDAIIEPKKATEKLVPGNTVFGRRRSCPPEGRNKNARPAKIQPRSSSPVLRSGGIRKARPGRTRITRSKNNSFSSIRPNRGSKGESGTGRGRLGAGRDNAILIELD